MSPPANGRQWPRRRLRAPPAVLLLLLVGAPSAEGQVASRPLAAGDHGAAPASLSGRAIDVTADAPLPGVRVLVRPDLPDGAGGAGERSAETDSAGRYRIDDLPAGRVRVVAAAPGYLELSLVVDLAPAEEARISLGLIPSPLPLLPLNVSADARPPLQRVAPEPTASKGGAATPGSRPLGTDARSLTRTSLERALTLAEPDILRALLRLPSATTRSDYTAELWTRGAPWHQTRVTFDGVPVFGPLHALGMFSGFNAGSVGTVWFYPGVRPASFGDGAAGTVAVETRPGAGGGELQAEVDVSLLSAGATLSQRPGGGPVRWMVSGRQTHAEWATRVLTPGGDHRAWDFRDFTGRVDLQLSERSKLEVSGTSQRDRLGDDEEPDLAHWSAEAARITGVWTTAGAEVSHTISFSRTLGAVSARPEGTASAAQPDPPPERSHTELVHLGLAGSVRDRAGPDDAARWSAGWELEGLASTYDGRLPFPLPRTHSEGPAGEDENPFSASAIIARGAVWADGRLSVGPSVAAQVGLRVERALAGELSGTRLAPRAVLQWRGPGGAVASVAAGRTWQYVQALAPTGVHIASLSSSDVWLLAGGGVPALRADLVSLGLRAPLAAGWEGTVHGYARRSSGLAMPDPTPGPLYGRPLWVIGGARAGGVEVLLEKSQGRWNASLAYAYTRSTLAARSLRFPAPSERPHALDATLLAHATPRLRFGAAFSAASGVRFTHIQGSLGCPAGEPCPPQSLPWVGAPSGGRAPAHASLDLLAERDWAVAGGRVTVFAQLRNVLGRENGTFYTLARPGCDASSCGSRRVLETRHEPGLPRLPVIGVRARF